MSWFKQISVKDYENLIKNKNKMYNITPQFSSPELLNKYRDDYNINKKIEIDNQINKQNENLSKTIDRNLNKYLEEKEDTSKYKDLYTFNHDDDILNSFNKIFNEYNLTYNPRPNTTDVPVQYLLNKLERSTNIPKELFRYFDNTLRNNKKLNLKLGLTNRNINTSSEIIRDDLIDQSGGNLNNIKIDENALNKNILKIRYINGRKLNNKLLKYDYKISNKMKDAIKFNRDVYKLSNNEKNIFYELRKYIDKDKSLDVLIGSYLSGNINKKLFNRINQILYDKYKNNLISQKEYTNFLNQINNS